LFDVALLRIGAVFPLMSRTPLTAKSRIVMASLDANAHAACAARFPAKFRCLQGKHEMGADVTKGDYSR
jgi:hypothetical protein